jgi:oligoribonuclease (3'-5' exoribonuclease)
VETVYLDTETTGINPGHDDLVEIAILDDGGSPLVNTLVRP